MARIVVWTEAAADSLLKAAEYIAADSPAYAAPLVSGADLTAQSLTDFPFRGRFVPEFNDQSHAGVIRWELPTHLSRY